MNPITLEIKGKIRIPPEKHFSKLASLTSKKKKSYCTNLPISYCLSLTKSPDCPRSWNWCKRFFGPNLLVFETVFFIKEAHTPHFVSWHQDLTYWGLDELSKVTAWVALIPATAQSGCMQFVPGSHHKPIGEHHDTFEEINMLSRGQILSKEVREEETIDIVLHPGKMSLHHGRMFHASPANRSADRRIGLAIR